MKRGSTKLASAPFICLYVAATAALVLEGTRQRWGKAPWFPIAVGLTAALAIIPLKHFLHEWLLGQSANDWGRAVFFLLVGLLPFAAFPFLGRDDILLICGSLALSLFLFWAALGTLLHWPGFRPPPPHDKEECPCCGCDLTGNDGGVCPECGAAVGSAPDE